MIPSVSSVTSEKKASRVITHPATAYFPSIGKSITVEKGFHYRPGVSVRLGSLGLMDLFGPTYALEDASCFHDWVYRNRDKYDMTRAEADQIMLADKKDPYWIRVTAWALVRIFGGLVW